MSKHTPGPWTVECRQDGKLGVKAGSACLIATVGKQAASHVDNAYLIAAAPEMIDLLVRILEQTAPPKGGGHPNVLCYEHALEVRSLISKILGEDLIVWRSSDEGR